MQKDTKVEKKTEQNNNRQNKPFNRDNNDRRNDGQRNVFAIIRVFQRDKRNGPVERFPPFLTLFVKQLIYKTQTVRA